MNPFDQTPGLEAHLRQPQGRVVSVAVGRDEARMELSRQAAYQRRLQDMARMRGLTLRQYKALIKGQQ